MTGHSYQGYAITLGGPPPRISVTCTPAGITRADASNPVSCTASATGGTLAITGWTFTATDAATGSVTSNQTSPTWGPGMAVASGGVTVQGTVGGFTAVSDTGRISVTNRTTGWSWSADTSTGNATAGTFECNTKPHYNTGQFGLTHADSTCKNIGVMLWPDPSISKRGYKIAQVPPGGPNAGLWYATVDVTGMHIRAQVLKDIRPDGFTYSITGKDTVATRCKAAGVSGKATVTVVNNTCMTDPSSFNFAALYAFAWRHEGCHLMQMRNAFPTIPDPRTRLETIVRSDTNVFHTAAVYDPGGYNDANAALTGANTIDVPGPPPPYTFWSRNRRTPPGSCGPTYQMAFLNRGAKCRDYPEQLCS